MVDWNKLVENGNKCGAEYTFYDNTELNKCRCGGNAKIYSKRRVGQPHSFEHLCIRCEKCNNSISGVYDMSGEPSKNFPEFEVVMKEKIREWNEQCSRKVEWKLKIKGFIIYISFKLKRIAARSRSINCGKE